MYIYIYIYISRKEGKLLAHVAARRSSITTTGRSNLCIYIYIYIEEEKRKRVMLGVINRRAGIGGMGGSRNSNKLERMCVSGMSELPTNMKSFDESAIRNQQLAKGKSVIEGKEDINEESRMFQSFYGNLII